MAAVSAAGRIGTGTEGGERLARASHRPHSLQPGDPGGEQHIPDIAPFQPASPVDRLVRPASADLRAVNGTAGHASGQRRDSARATDSSDNSMRCGHGTDGTGLLSTGDFLYRNFLFSRPSRKKIPSLLSRPTKIILSRLSRRIQPLGIVEESTGQGAVPSLSRSTRSCPEQAQPLVIVDRSAGQASPLQALDA